MGCVSLRCIEAENESSSSSEVAVIPLREGCRGRERTTHQVVVCLLFANEGYHTAASALWTGRIVTVSVCTGSTPSSESAIRSQFGFGTSVGAWSNHVLAQD